MSLRQTAAELQHLLQQKNQVVHRIHVLEDNRQLGLANVIPQGWQHHIWFSDCPEWLELVHPDEPLVVPCTFAFGFRCFTARVGDEELLRACFGYTDLWICQGAKTKAVVDGFNQLYESHAVVISQFIALQLGHELEYDPRVMGSPMQTWQVTEAITKLRGKCYLLNPPRMEEFGEFLDGRLFPPEY